MKRSVTTGLLLAVLGTTAGCKMIGALSYWLGPKRTQKAEYTLAQGPLAILIDVARPTEENPLFVHELHAKLVEIFREQKVNTRVVALEEEYRLRQAHPDFGRWSVPKIGRELGAEEVLYLRVERLQVREAGDAPVVNPAAEIRVKVIDANSSAQRARLWPTDLAEKTVVVKRPPAEAPDMEAVDRAAAALGREAARQIAMFFYEVDLEQPKQKEP